MQIPRRVEAERQAEDSSVFELGEEELRLRLDTTAVLSEHFCERPVGDASAVGRAATREPPWRRKRVVQPIPQLAREPSLAHTRLAYDRDELRSLVPDDPLVGGL